MASVVVVATGMRDGALRSAWYLVVSLAFAPGIVAHEYAHAIACLCCGVEVRAGPSLNPLGSAAYLEHDPVRSFWADLTIAAAPIVGNSALAIGAFAAAVAVDGAESAVPGGGTGVGPILLVLIGACFGLTALPSPGDTDHLLETARGFPGRSRPIAVVLAASLRALTARSSITGFAAFVWTIVLYAAVAGGPPT